MIDYDMLCKQVQEILNADPWYIPAMSNISALLMDTLPDLNWAGFYLHCGPYLVVGPFQGKPACIHIPIGKGVCGKAAAEDQIINVPDVHQFPGHIACDSASNSEIVIPLHAYGKPFAVMDIDSPVFHRFTEADEAGLKKIADVMDDLIHWE